MIMLVLGLFIGAILGVLLFYLLYVKKVKDDCVLKEANLSQLNDNLFRENMANKRMVTDLRQKVNALKRENGKLLEENISLGKEIDSLRSTQQSMNGTIVKEATPASTNQVSTPKKEPPTTLYAEAIIDGYFVKVSEMPKEDSVFVLHLDGEASAIFSIYEPAYQRIIANPSFLEGCEKQVIGDTKQLEIVSGNAKRESLDDKWKVINKLNVIIR